MTNYAIIMLSHLILKPKRGREGVTSLITHHRHFTLVYLFDDNLTTIDTETAQEPSIYYLQQISKHF